MKTYNVTITIDDKGRAHFTEALRIQQTNQYDVKVTPTNSRRVAREVNKAAIVIK